MKMAKEGCGIVAVNNLIYVCGGVCKDIIFNTFEMYDIKNNTWTDLASMNRKRSNFKVIKKYFFNLSFIYYTIFLYFLQIVYYKKYIYAFGGEKLSDKERQSIERYNLKTDVWEILNFHINCTSATPGIIAGNLIYIGTKNILRLLVKYEFHIKYLNLRRRNFAR